jgi:hypothetical protein
MASFSRCWSVIGGAWRSPSSFTTICSQCPAFADELGAVVVGGGYERAEALLCSYLIEGALQRTLAGAARTTRDRDAQGCLENLQIRQPSHPCAEVIVGIREEAGLDLAGAEGVRAEGRHHADLFLACQGLQVQLIPALVEAILVVDGPGGGPRPGRGAGSGGPGEADGGVGAGCLLLHHPERAAVAETGAALIALLKAAAGRHWHDALVEGRRGWVGFATDDTEEAWVSAATAAPAGERP